MGTGPPKWKWVTLERLITQPFPAIAPRGIRTSLKPTKQSPMNSSSSRRSSGALSPPRPQMLGTVLPQDSLRGMRHELTLLPPPPPSTQQSATQQSSTTHEHHHIKLLAAAGRDLFRQGLAFDGVRPTKQEPRHPAVTPNLLSIPEDDSISASAPSELVVVVGGPLNERGEPGVWVANRIAMAIQIYWQVLLSFAHEDEDDEQDDERPAPLCYVVPTGGESNDEGIIETEAIRNALVSTGVSPHHIVMDCTATSLVDNALQLMNILRHLHVSKVHVVASAFQLARVRMCYEQILGSAGDLQGLQLAFHGARDGLSAGERAERAALEQSLLQQTHAEIDWALQRMHIKAAKASKRKTKSSSNERRPTFHSDV